MQLSIPPWHQNSFMHPRGVTYIELLFFYHSTIQNKRTVNISQIFHFCSKIKGKTGENCSKVDMSSMEIEKTNTFMQIEKANTLKFPSKNKIKNFKVLTFPTNILRKSNNFFKVQLFCYIFWKTNFLNKRIFTKNKLKRFVLDVPWIRLFVLAKLNILRVKIELFDGLSKNFLIRKFQLFSLDLIYTALFFLKSGCSTRIYIN